MGAPQDYKRFTQVKKLIQTKEQELIENINELVDKYIAEDLSNMDANELNEIEAIIEKHGICSTFLREPLRMMTRQKRR